MARSSVERKEGINVNCYLRCQFCGDNRIKLKVEFLTDEPTELELKAVCASCATEVTCFVKSVFRKDPLKWEKVE